ncbi:MAG: hypothetical protein ACP5FH_08150 [Terracidiphilus sp.]
MPDDKFPEQAPIYTFQGNSPADELLEIARMHHEQAKLLFDRALAAHLEGRQEESGLLKDLAFSQRKRAEEFERAARGETGDPIVAEILESQQSLREKTSSTYTPTFISKDDSFQMELPKHMQPPPPGPIARAVAWISRRCR